MLRALLLAAITMAPCIATPPDCAEWGFHSPQCTDCDSLAKFVGEGEADLIDACMQCCVSDAATTYTMATLYVSEERLE